jgi:hypothetical protein
MKINNAMASKIIMAASSAAANGNNNISGNNGQLMKWRLAAK